MSMVNVNIRLPADAIARLDELRGAASRSGFVRDLLRQASPPAPATHDEALLLLAQAARGGNVAAVVALEKATRREKAETDIDDALTRILGED